VWLPQIGLTGLLQLNIRTFDQSPVRQIGPESGQQSYA
jgi:hypothetical protein